ncbi:MAG: nucleoside hydrolase [Pseudomonadota bacterium]|nr:nucleoside hydrolase [Pseudomonadota bacterium]
MTSFIIDCDPGHDDAVAIVVAGRHLDVIGVTTVFGNSTIENTTRNALNILDGAGFEHIPVAPGASGPLFGLAKTGEGIHGKSGLDGATLPGSTREAIDQDAADFIIQASHEHDDLVIISVAPETNLAIALERDPTLASRVSEISIMGGSTTHGNATAAAEYNIYADPEAASIVFESGIPIRMVGLNVTSTFGVTQTELDKLHAANGIGRELAGALQFYLDRQTSTYEHSYAPMHDTCAVIPYINPLWIEYHPLHVVVECAGTHTRGMTLCDTRGSVIGGENENSQTPNAQVAIMADADAIIAQAIADLSHH